MDINDIQKHIDQMMHEQNSRPIPEFEGYSPDEMFKLMYYTYEEGSPIQLQKLDDADYQKIPMLNQIKYLMELIDKNGEVKLTNKGFLPTKVVSELYQQGFIKEEFIEIGISKLYKESDSMTISLTRILTELAGLIKKRNGKISLTKSSKILLGDNEKLLRLLLESYANKFNWAYFDEYGDNQIGQLCYGYSLILLAKYGHKKRLDTFYAEKYFKAFPMLLESVVPKYNTLEGYAGNCYSLRTFDRFLDYFGLITIDKDSKFYDSPKYITKTDLFDKLIKCKPHKVQ